MNQWLKFDPLLMFRLLKRMYVWILIMGPQEYKNGKKKKEFGSSSVAINMGPM